MDDLETRIPFVTDGVEVTVGAEDRPTCFQGNSREEDVQVWEVDPLFSQQSREFGSLVPMMHSERLPVGDQEGPFKIGLLMILNSINKLIVGRTRKRRAILPE